jgi:hypothetical protein
MTISEVANATLDAAFMYASDGVRVFPIGPEKKRPLIKDWPNVATTDPEQIRAWWTKWPDAMIGAATGEGSRFWALDLDKKLDRDGFASLVELEAKHGKLPATYRAQTPSAGEHRYFRYPPGVRIGSRAGDIAPGIDTRGGRENGSSTGYVVLPSSTRRDGKSYRALDASDLVWAIGPQLPDAPDWLIFLAMFNTRQRAQLASAGITGHEGFGGAAPAEWLSLADAAVGKKQANGQAVQPLDTKTTDVLINYCSAAINNEIEAIAAAEIGEQDRTINNGGLAIHSLISGARVRGVDAQSLATIEASTRESYCAAVIALPCGKTGEPWTKQDAIAKWQRTCDDAEPRNLWHVGGSNADREFGDIVLPENVSKKAPRSRQVLWFDEQPLQAEVSWLVDEAIPTASIGFLVAKPGLGKTFLAIDLALCVGLGVPFFGREISGRGGTHIIAAEGGYGVQARVRAAIDHKFAKIELPAGVDALRIPITYEKGAPNLLNPKSLADFIDDMKGHDARMRSDYGVPYRLIIVDTFGQAFTLEDENAASSVAKATHAMQQIADALNVAVVSVHHYGKDASAGMRGSSALEGNADFTLAVKKPRELWLDKCRDAPDDLLLGYFDMPIVEMGVKPNGKPVTSRYIAAQADQWPGISALDIEPNRSESVFAVSFAEALKTKGETRNFGGGAICRMVRMGDVKLEFNPRWGTTPEANRKAFRRVKQAIAERYSRIEFEGELWIGELPAAETPCGLSTGG